MNRGRLTFLALSVTVVTAITAGSWGARASSRPEGEDGDSLFKYLSVFSEVLSLVRQAYVDETESSQLLTAAMDGVSDALDPFSLYVPAEGAVRYAETRRIGASRSGLQLLNENGMPYVVGVIEGSPAAKAGFERGDLLSKVDEHSTRTLPRWELESHFAAAPGTSLQVELIRGAEPLQKTLKLASYPSPSPSMEEKDGVVVLRVPWFDGDSAAWVRRNLARWGEPARPLLIDLRDASGGSPEAGYAVAGLFADGALGVLAGRDQELASFTGSARLWRGPVVVAVNRWTQGAAEILAEVLKQRVEARLVGEATFGSVSRQKIVDVPSGGRLWVSEGFFTGPDKKPLREGLEPQIRVRDRDRSFEDRALSLDEMILRRALDTAKGVVPATEPAKAA
jgi:carboxyl-terminal processing protease